MSREGESSSNAKAWAIKKMQAAPTPRRKLWEACSWLVAESWRAGTDAINESMDVVLDRVYEIRGEHRHGHRHGQ